MKCVVTGAAGFIGSHLCEELLARGHQVAGLDSFVPYYPRWYKEGNLAAFASHPSFCFHEADLRDDDLAPILDGADAVFHLAAMPGLARSWTEFDLYQGCNLTGTQRLLEACRHVSLRRFVLASTSSIYGKHACGGEDLPARPVSPYGVTKLAAENLCRAHFEERGLPLIVLRYFSVYGPRQRPDMAYHLFIRAMLDGLPLALHGDGLQVRGNTFVTDCVAATVAALDAPTGETFNVGGGESASLWDILGKLERIVGRKAILRREPGRAGDQRVTGADTARLTRFTGWQPRVGLDEGLTRQVAWQRGLTQRQAA